jgi:hypothetical protein
MPLHFPVNLAVHAMQARRRNGVPLEEINGQISGNLI